MENEKKSEEKVEELKEEKEEKHLERVEEKVEELPAEEKEKREVSTTIHFHQTIARYTAISFLDNQREKRK